LTRQARAAYNYFCTEYFVIELIMLFERKETDGCSPKRCGVWDHAVSEEDF